jgi:hypothetical protein
MRIRSVLLIPFVLTACGTFFPAFEDAAIANLKTGLDEVSFLVAKTELGDYTSPSSYAGAADRYATALASVQAAGALVTATPAAGPAREASTAVGEMIANCAEAITLMSSVHRDAGLPASAGFSNVRETCAAPYNSLR